MKSIPLELDLLTSVAAAVLDADGLLREANPGFLRLLPAVPAGWIGVKVARFFVQPAFAVLNAGAAAQGNDDYRGLMTIGDYAGKTRTLRGRVWRSAAGLRVLAEYDIDELEKLGDAMLELNRESSVARHALTGANIALKQREVQIVEASLIDVLTGVGNRRKLEQSLASEIVRARRLHDALSIFMTDVDHFKRVNDEYGHGGGDKVLVRLGALLRSNTRSTDIVARFGGEEFVVLMPHTSLAQAKLKAELLRSALAAEIIEPLTRAVTASFGVAELAPDEDGASLLGRADAALYQAKKSGRNCVVVHDAVNPAPTAHAG